MSPPLHCVERVAPRKTKNYISLQNKSINTMQLVPKLHAFKLDLSTPEDLTARSVDLIAAWIPEECYQYAMVLERGEKNDKLHAHIFFLTKRTWTVSAWGKHMRRIITRLLLEGGNTVGCSTFKNDSCYDDNYVQTYIQKDPDRVHRLWHIDDDVETRAQHYRKRPNTQHITHNASFRSICKEFAAAHPGKRANFDSVSRFIWSRMKSHKMKIEPNPNKMLRLVRVAVTLINDSPDYDYDTRHPDNANFY